MGNRRFPMAVLLFAGMLFLSVVDGTSHPSWVVRVGTLFNIWNERGNPDMNQAQALAAFVMGIKEINANSTISGNFQFEWTVANLADPRGGHNAAGAARQADYLVSSVNWPVLSSSSPPNFLGTYAATPQYVATENSGAITASDSQNGVDLVVGGNNNEETMTADIIYATRKLIQIHTVANETALGNGVVYPFKLQTNPIESYQGMVLQQLMCNEFDTKNVVLFYTDSTSGTKARMENLDGTYCPFNVQGQFIVAPAPWDYTEVFYTLINSGAEPRYFVFFTDPLTASQLILQGSALGLFGPGCQLFGPADVTVPEFITNDIANTAVTGNGGRERGSTVSANAPFTRDQIAKLMKGYLGVRYAPGYGMRGAARGGTYKGADFYERFTVLTAAALCDQKDSFGVLAFRKTGASGQDCVFDGIAKAKTASLTASGVRSITLVSTLDISVGAVVSGTGIVTGTTVATVTSNTNIITLSGPTTSSTIAAGTVLTFTSSPFSFLALRDSQNDGRKVYPFAPHAYDAIHAAAHGVRKLEINNGFTTNASTKFDLDLLMNVLIDDVDFIGATGRINFFEGMEEFNTYARGGREQGHTYTLWNFNPQTFSDGATNDSVFSYTGTWNIKTNRSGEWESGGVKWCDATGATNAEYADEGGNYPCASVLFNTLDGGKPSSTPPYSTDTPPAIIKIGGFFSLIDSVTGKTDQLQAQALAAFLMAVKDVNAATRFKHPFKLKTAVFGGTGFTAAVEAASYMIEKAFGGSGVDVIIGAGLDVATMASDSMLAGAKVVQIHTRAQETRLGKGVDYPYKIQTCTLDSFMGMVLQSIMCQTYGYHKMAIFATNDEIGTMSTMESGENTYCEINRITMSSQRFDLGATDLSEWDLDINNAIQGGSRVFLFFLPYDAAARVIVRGYQLGLFGMNTQLFINQYSLTPLFTQMVYSLTKSHATTKTILRGLVGVKYAPNFNLRYPADHVGASQPMLSDPYKLKPKNGKQFLEAFKNLPSTAGIPQSSGGRYVDCDQAKDDAEEYFLWREQRRANRSDPQVLCTGIDFQGKFLQADGTDV